MPRRFNPLVVPKHLQKDLPFKSKPKLLTKRKKPSLETRRAVVMEPDEKRVSAVNMLSDPEARRTSNAKLTDFIRLSSRAVCR